MKIKRLLVCILIAAIPLTFTACSDDEDEPVAATPASSLAVGTYTGTVTMVFAYGELEYEGRVITLTASDSDHVRWVFSDEELGEIDMTVPVTLDADGSVVIPATDGTLLMPLHSGDWADYACLVSATIAADKSDYIFVIDVPAVMGGTTYTLVPSAE